MRAIGVMRYGGPEALEVLDVPSEPIGPGRIRLRVHAAAVNPTDTYVRNGDRAEQQKVDPPPYVPGMDVAGIVAEIGPDTTTALSVGDRAMAIVLPRGAHGGYREDIVLPADSVAAAPSGSTHADAASLPMNGLTARLSLDLLGLQPGQVLAVTGSAGAYGGYVVQLAKADGLVVVADASEADRPLVEALGADLVVPRGPGFAAAVRQHHPDGVDGLADGSVQGAEVLDVLRDGGAYTSVRGYRPPPERGLRGGPTWVWEYGREQAKLDRLGRQAEAGAITLRVAASYPPEQAGEAHRRLEAGGTRGRLIIEL